MTRFLAVSAALFGAGWLLAAPAAKPAAPDYQDFVYFGESRPILIRVHAEIDGRPIEAAWNDFIDRLFAYIDADGDGALSRDELQRAPSPQTLFNNNPFGFVGRFGSQAPGDPYVMDRGTPKWTKEKLAAVFRRTGGAPYQLQLGAAPANVFTANGRVLSVGGLPAQPVSADALNDALFELLDTDKDGKLSREELAAAPEILMKLDADEDEVVTLGELLPRSVPPANSFVVRAPGPMPAAPPPANGPFVMATPTQAANLVKQLEMRYGPKDGRPPSKLTRKDLGLDQRAFDLLDADQNGELDEEELMHFTERPADLDLKVRLGKRSPREAAVEVMTDAGRPSPLGDAVKAAGGAVRLDLGNARLEMRGVEEGRPAAPDFLRQQYLAQFKAADRDNNGYLDEKEAMQSPFFQGVFKAMDRDGDGKLFEKEVIAYLDAMKDLQEAAAAGCATVSFSDDSRGLFDLIDLNHDGRLSLREMRQMVKLIDQLDTDGDGKISRSEIQKSYQIVFRQGPPGVPGFNGPVVIAKPVGMAPASPAAPQPTAGPLWFRKMDRNHDGDVSRKEFLGTDEEFKRLDLDGDGLISVDEAEKADAMLRKGKE